nr:MAG TPA: hypothetical protein [Caudoviricetes sp.]
MVQPVFLIKCHENIASKRLALNFINTNSAFLNNDSNKVLLAMSKTFLNSISWNCDDERPVGMSHDSERNVDYLQASIWDPITGKLIGQRRFLQKINKCYYTYELRFDYKVDHWRFFLTTSFYSGNIIVTYEQYKNSSYPKKHLYDPENKTANQITDLLSEYTDYVHSEVSGKSLKKHVLQNIGDPCKPFPGDI